jgi:hypothetical protein
MRVHRGALFLAALAAGASWALPVAAAAERASTLEDVRLRLLEGGTAPLVEKGSAATVLLFFRPGQDRSIEALRAIGECRAGLAGKPVRLAGIVSDRDAPEEVRSALAAAGARLPVLLDEGDALYARLAVRTHPAIFVVDEGRRVVAHESFHPVGLCDVVRARVRFLLGEITEAELARALVPAESQMPGDDPIGVAARHVKFGRKLLAARSFAPAHENARRSLALAPSAAAWTLEGEIFAAEGKCADAVRAFDAALALDPADAAAAAGRRGCAP